MNDLQIMIDPSLADQMGEMFALVDPDEYRLDAASELLLQGMTEEAVDLIMRTDAANPSSSPYSRDDLVQTLRRIYETEYMANTVQEAFAVNNELRPGKQTWRAYRINSTGMPQLLGEGGRINDIPEVTLSNDYEDFSIDYYAISVSQTYMEQLAETAVARTVRSRARKLQKAREAVDRFVDMRAWGKAFDNPYVPLYLSTQDIGEDITPADMIKDARKFINYNISAIKGHNKRRPRVLWTSPRIYSVYEGTYVDNTRRVTLLDEIKKRTSINDVRESPRLENIGGHNVDGMVALPSNQSIELMIALPFTTLPAERTGLVTRSINVAGDGGLNFMDSLGSSIGLFPWKP